MYSLKNTWAAQALNIIAVAMLIASSFVAFAPNTSSAAAEKVTICHKTGNDTWEIMPEVNVNAVDSHLDHGDFVVDDENTECPPEEEEELSDEEQCEIAGGTWIDGACLTDEQLCILGGEMWYEGECFPNEDFLCEILGGAGPPIPDFCDEDPQDPTDHCSTVVGTQGPEYDCPSQSEVDCENAGGTWNGTSCDMPQGPAQCADGIDNDSDGSTDMNDVGCTDSSDNDESNGGDGDTGGSGDSSSSGGNGGGGGGSSKKKSDGEVAGASTDCSVLLTTYIGVGKNNDLSEVVKLQMFLMAELGLLNLVTGSYDAATQDAVDQFQLKYSTEVLAPWVPHGLPSAETPTTYVYKTTQRMINNIHCPSLNLSMPLLP